MPMLRRTRKGTNAQFDKAFAPVALQIGYLTREWNQLHEILGMIFATMISPVRMAIPLAVWHSTPNDRAQREMLSAANRAWRLQQHDILKAVASEIEWLLSETDKLANKRNDAIHAPINILMDTTTFEFNVEPNHFWGNPRAKRLVGKNVLEQYRHYRSITDVLYRYAAVVHVALSSGVVLPQRPSLPTFEQSQVAKKVRRPKPARKPPPLLSSLAE